MQESGKARGGRARAEKLTDARKSEIAKKGAKARWEKLPHAVCGSPDNPLTVGNAAIQCYVLVDGTRVLSQGDFLESLGRHRKANVRRESQEEQLPAILQGKSISAFITDDLREKSRPIKFRTTEGARASGYRAEVLPLVCEVYLKARDAGMLNRQMQHVADRAEILMRGFAQVGIIALVDEATGYQDYRTKNALAEILEAYIAEELRKWIKTFPIAYFKELCRLRGVAFREDLRFPSYFGHLTNDVVYSRLAPGVLDELRRKNPRVGPSGRRHKHHQWLTESMGHPKLLNHMTMVVGLMRASDDYDQFQTMLNRAAPVYRDAPLFAEIIESENQ